MATQNRRTAQKSPMSSLVIIALALLVFVAAVGIGVSLLGKKDPPAPSVSEPVSVSEPAVVDPASEAPVSEAPVSEAPSSVAPSSAAPSSAAPSSVAPSSQAPASSTPAPAPTNIPTAFDPASMGDSNFFSIPSYKQINADVKGWLKIPGTNIDYPVLNHTTNVLYYNDKNIYRQYDKNGVMYTAPGQRFGNSDNISKNSVIFGHNWTNYSANPRVGNASDIMFAQLTAYHHLAFANAYPYFYYSTDAQEMVWKIFAVFYTDVGFNYIEPNPNDTQFMEIVNGAKARSRHIFGTDVNATDKIVTLSTCTRAYGSSNKQRFVVMARMLRDGEKLSAVSVTSNPNPVLPKL